MKNKIILIIICFYFIFLGIDFSGRTDLTGWSVLIKYACIILCFSLTLLIGSKGHNRTDTRLLQTAMLLTVSADLFLLVLDIHAVGIFFFCLVQSVYILRHSRASRFNTRLFVLIFTPLAIGLIISVINDPVTILASIYACLSIFSIATAFSTLKYEKYPEKTKAFVISGLLLLLFCDINVALFNIYGSLLSGLLMWFFYLPSQLLLSLSGEK